jgi:hypothetical protein
MQVSAKGSSNVTVTKVSPLTGKPGSMVLPLNILQFHSAYIKWSGGEVVQSAFPGLNADQREFIMTGYTPADWEAMYGPADED